MNFYNQQHKYYCGIDLHARKMFGCIIDIKGKVLLHLNINTDPQLPLEMILPYLDDPFPKVESLSLTLGRIQLE